MAFDFDCYSHHQVQFLSLNLKVLRLSLQQIWQEISWLEYTNVQDLGKADHIAQSYNFHSQLKFEGV